MDRAEILHTPWKWSEPQSYSKPFFDPTSSWIAIGSGSRDVIPPNRDYEAGVKSLSNLPVWTKTCPYQKEFPRSVENSWFQVRNQGQVT